MMFLQRIQRNKLLQVVMSVILCIVLMFCIVSKPFEVKVNAIAGIDDGLFWTIVSVMLELGIVVDVTDPDARQAVADFFWSLTDQLRDEIGIAAAFWRHGYSVYYDWAVESWSNIAHAIGDWFTTERYPQSSIVFGDVSANNIDFYTRNSFSFNFPSVSSTETAFVYFSMNDCEIQYVFHPTLALRNSWLCLGSSTSSDRLNGYLVKISPNHFDFSFVYHFSENISVSNKSFFNQTWDPRFDSAGEYLSDCFLKSSDDKYIYLLHRFGYFISGNTRYKLTGSRGSTFSFVNESDSSDVYNDLVFDSAFDALVWFFNLCDIDVRRGSSSAYFSGEVVTDPIVIDPETVQNALDNIDALPADTTVPVILPGNEVQYRQLVNDVPVSNLYDTDIDIPTVDGNLWKTKFPFCIPFDLINLFSGFSAEAEAPSFHVLVMPANSFGLDNDDIYWDIDFQPYNYLVQILRFFLALSFVLWLIVITRKLIRG